MCDNCPVNTQENNGTSERRFFETQDGLCLSYLTCDKRVKNKDGCYENDCRAPIVALHGLGANASYWNCLMNKMCPFANMFALDLPASGYSNHSVDRPIDVETLTGYVEEFVNHLGLDRFFLVGHNIGAIIALSYASIATERVVRVVVSGANPQPLPFADPDYEFTIIPELQQLIVQSLLPDADLCENAQIFSNLLDPVANCSGNLLTLQFANSFGQLSLYQQFLERANIRDRLASIVAPVMIIGGTEDPTTPIGANGVLRESIPNSSLVEFYGYGNNVAIFNTTTYNTHVFSFFFVLSDACCDFIDACHYNLNLDNVFIESCPGDNCCRQTNCHEVPAKKPVKCFDRSVKCFDRPTMCHEEPEHVLCEETPDHKMSRNEQIYHDQKLTELCLKNKKEGKKSVHSETCRIPCKYTR
jgi:pimeloyl-ACP methyl ester carboxylesterase